MCPFSNNCTSPCRGCRAIKGILTNSLLAKFTIFHLLCWNLVSFIYLAESELMKGLEPALKSTLPETSDYKVLGGAAVVHCLPTNGFTKQLSMST